LKVSLKNKIVSWKLHVSSTNTAIKHYSNNQIKSRIRPIV